MFLNKYINAQLYHSHLHLHILTQAFMFLPRQRVTNKQVEDEIYFMKHVGQSSFPLDSKTIDVVNKI